MTKATTKEELMKRLGEACGLYIQTGDWRTLGEMKQIMDDIRPLVVKVHTPTVLKFEPLKAVPPEDDEE